MGTDFAARLPQPSSFAVSLGIETLTVTADEVVCAMTVTPAMANRNGVLHGGALMTLSDTAAGSVAFVHTPDGMTNTTVEAKTNFMRAVRVGDRVTARCTILHQGRSTIVLQVTMTRGDGKTVGVTMQTHLLMRWEGETEGRKA